MAAEMLACDGFNLSNLVILVGTRCLSLSQFFIHLEMSIT